MDDAISRQQAINALVAETIYTEEELKEYYEANSHRNEWVNGIYESIETVKQLPPIHPANCSEFPNNSDTINRQAAIDALRNYLVGKNVPCDGTLTCQLIENEVINKLPFAELGTNLAGVDTDVHDKNVGELISRQSAVDELVKMLSDCFYADEEVLDAVETTLKELPSAQPERTCVNCGRTVNNGGWYADGGTRCPIEEHYALPKDGYCHLWEKRNVTDDDYPERRTDE